jgi:cell division protein FtsB
MSTLMSQARTRVPRFAETAVERARLTVVPRRSAPATRAPFVTLVTLLLMGGVVGLLLFNTSMQQASFTATSLEETATTLDAREQALEMQLHQLRDPQRVAERAKRLGMVPAGSPAFLRLSDGAVLGNPAPADPADAMRIEPLPAGVPKILRPEPVIVKADPEDASNSSGDTGADGRGNGHRAGTKKQTSAQGE